MRENWLNLGVKGAATWPDTETRVQFGGHEIVLLPATRTREQSVRINVRRLTHVEAMTLANRFLSVLSWCSDQGMENLYGWVGNPKPAPVPRETRVVGSTGGIGFPFYRQLPTDSKVRLALALYREGLTVNSGPFQFLSFFKILNVFWPDKTRNGKNPLVEGMRAVLPKLNDPQAKRRIEALVAAGEDVATYLYQDGRCAIAHAYAEPVVDPDDVSDLRRLSEDQPIIKAIAAHLIECELEPVMNLPPRRLGGPDAA